MINLVAFQELASDRIVLRRLKKSDKKRVQFLRSDPGVNQYVKRPKANTEKKALEFIGMIQEGMKIAKHYYWVISLKTDPKMIGSISLWNFSDDRQFAEVGYDLHPEFQGKGLMTETLKLVLEFGFERLKLNSIEAYTQNNNQPSIKMLVNNGFVLVEGKTDPSNGDNCIYQIKNKLN